MKVGIQAKLKNGILWEAVKKMGSAAALARHIGIHPSRMGDWLHFNNCPAFDSPAYKQRYSEIEVKLQELTGHSLEEIFPKEIRSRAFREKQKKIDAIVEMPVEALVAAGAMPQLPPMPDELVFQKEGRAVINHILDTLTPDEQKTIKMRFGLEPYGVEHGMTEIARDLGMSTQRISEIQKSAFAKFRKPSRAVKLRPWADVEEAIEEARRPRPAKEKPAKPPISLCQHEWGTRGSRYYEKCTRPVKANGLCGIHKRMQDRDVRIEELMKAGMDYTDAARWHKREQAWRKGAIFSGVPNTVTVDGPCYAGDSFKTEQ